MAEAHNPPSGVQPDEVILSITGKLDPWLARKVLEGAPAIIYVYDVKAERSIFQNRPLGELLGYPAPDEADSQSEWRRYIHPDDGVAFPEHRARLKAIKPDETLSWQFRLRHADGAWRHFVSRDVLLSSDAEGAPWLIVGSTTDMSEQKSAEDRKTIVLNEMRHRVRNFASVMEGIGRQSLPPGDMAVSQFFQTLMGRIRSLLDAGEIVITSDTRTADLRAVARTTLTPFTNDAASAITMDGPAIGLPEVIAGSLALALHELATNAVKYGALSHEGGKIALSWRVEKAEGGQSRLALEWKEHTRRPVTPPAREGFGSRLIRFAAPQKSDGTVELLFEPDGVRCRIDRILPS
jgi:two-component sensor histidine kinase